MKMKVRASERPKERGRRGGGVGGRVVCDEDFLELNEGRNEVEYSTVTVTVECK